MNEQLTRKTHPHRFFFLSLSHFPFFSLPPFIFSLTRPPPISLRLSLVHTPYRCLAQRERTRSVLWLSL
jgi:hypothetical protein